MQIYLEFVVLGLAAGAIYAGLAMGLVVTYKSTGIINFAQGAFAAWGGYVYNELRSSGSLIFPLVPGQIHLATTVSAPVAGVIAVVSTGVLAALAHALIFRHLRRAPIMAATVASVGLMILVEALIVIRFGSQSQSVSPILSGYTWVAFGVKVVSGRIEFAALAVLTAVALWAWFRFTRIGLATRAAAESDDNAALSGLSTNFLALISWVLSGMIAAIFGVLYAPFVSLSPDGFILFVVPALAACLLARLRSFGLTCAVALGLGVFNSELQFLTTKSFWPKWASVGFVDTVPLILIVVALCVFGGRIPVRGGEDTRLLPKVFRPKSVARPTIMLAVAAAGAVVLTSGNYRFGLVTSMGLAIVMLSLVILTGYVGQISLAAAAFAGTGAFALSKLSSSLGLAFPWSMVVAALCASVLGVVIGLPALRIRGAQLAVVTFAAAFAVNQYIFQNPVFVGPGGTPVPSPRLLGVDLAVRQGTDVARLSFAWFVLGMLVVFALGTANLARSGTGRRLLAVRSNEHAAASIGISVARTRLLAFWLSSLMAGFAGTLLAYSLGQLSSTSFDEFAGLSFFAIAYMGGITSVTGALIAGVLGPLGIAYIFFNNIFNIGKYYLLLTGVGLVLTAVANPEGIAGNFIPLLGGWWRTAKGRLHHQRRGSFASPHSPVSASQARVLSCMPALVNPHPGGGDALLETRGLTVRYGGVTAVEGLDLSVRPGEIVGLIGPNGAGKTSVIDALTGFTPSAGTIDFLGRSMGGLAPFERCNLGLVRTWQSLQLFNDLTVRENILVAAVRSNPLVVTADLVAPLRRRPANTVDSLLVSLGLEEVADMPPSSLSLGHRKHLVLARALAASPRVVLLDEPGAGLGDEERASLGRHIAGLADRGLGVLLVDHNMQLVLGTCHRLYVLDFGRLIKQGSPSEVRADDRVISAYLGAGHGDTVVAAKE